MHSVADSLDSMPSWSASSRLTDWRLDQCTEKPSSGAMIRCLTVGLANLIPLAFHSNYNYIPGTIDGPFVGGYPKSVITKGQIHNSGLNLIKYVALKASKSDTCTSMCANQSTVSIANSAYLWLHKQSSASTFARSPLNPLSPCSR